MLQIPLLEECKEMSITELTQLLENMEKTREILKTIIRKKHMKIGPL